MQVGPLSMDSTPARLRQGGSGGHQAPEEPTHHHREPERTGCRVGIGCLAGHISRAEPHLRSQALPAWRPFLAWREQARPWTPAQHCLLKQGRALFDLAPGLSVALELLPPGFGASCPHGLFFLGLAQVPVVPWSLEVLSSQGAGSACGGRGSVASLSPRTTRKRG